MSAPNHAHPSLGGASRMRPESNTEKAEFILWQEYRQGHLTVDQLAHTLDLLEPERENAAFAHLLSARSHNQATDAVGDAEEAIWHLFDAGLIDDNSATVALLAIHVGVQRSSNGRRGGNQP
jgi:hypothetical protein